MAIATIEELRRAAAKYQDERLRAKIGGVAGSMPGTVHGGFVAMQEDEDDDLPPEVGPGGRLSEEHLRELGKMEGIGLPSLQSSQGPESGQPAGGRPRPKMVIGHAFFSKDNGYEGFVSFMESMFAPFEEDESPRSIAGEAPGGPLEPGGHVSAARPAGSMSGKMATPEQMKAALHYERDQGKGTPDEKAQKVAEHLTERPTYYLDLARMMDPDLSQIIRRSVTAVTPGELAKGLVEKVQDVAASRRAEKTRKKVLSEKKGAKGGGGWEKGPRGGMRKKVGGKWVYRGKTTEEGRAERGTGLKGGMPGAEEEEKPQHPPPSAEREAMMRDHPPEKNPHLYYESEGGKIPDEHRGKEGRPMPGEPGHDVPHPDTPHDSQPTHQGKSLDEAIKHLDTVDPKMLRKRGEHIAEEVARKDPEAAKRIKDAMAHLEHAVQIGKAKRERGQDAKKEDMTAGEALKSILRDFNAAAAPASVLGPELGGVLKADDPKDKDASAKAAEEEAKKSLTAADVDDALRGHHHPTHFLIPVDRFEKSGAYASGRWGPLPTVAPIAGSSPRDETPSLPDFQEIYYQPPSDARRKLEEEQDLTRRLATASRNTGVYGFHGTGLPRPEPVLHYVPTEQQHTGPKLSARKPLFEAKETDDQRRAGMPPPYGPEKDGGQIERQTDRGRTPRSPDRRDDEVPSVGGRPTPRDKADDEKLRAKMERHRNPRDPQDDLVGYLCDVFGIDEDGEERLRKKAAARLDKSELFEELYKGAKGGKYIKRVPYYKDGKKRYRYYYRESAIAREAKVGEEVKVGKGRLKVEEIHEDGSLTITIGGKSRKLTREQYTQLLARHYGARFYDHAEKRAKQAINAVFRHVPKAMLAELRGGTLEERLADLKQRAPKVYAKLEASFQRAGVSPERAKSIVTRSLERRGWSEEARAAAIGSVLTERVKAGSFHEVLRGAENLAAGGSVEVEHVGALVELKTGGGASEAGFADQVAKLAAQAETELMALSKLLMKASGDDDARAKALAEALTSTAIQKLNLLTQAFPGLKDKVADAARESILKVPALTKGPPKTRGAETVVFVAGENGEPTALKARYELREAGDVVASHDPTKGFVRRGDYPEGVQERAYHRDRDEQLKVMRNAQRLRGEFVINTNPDAVNGPPMVTESGHALGGNSRAMSMQLAYHEHPEVAERMKTYLAEHAHEVGFTTDDVAAMKRPILVRVIDNPEDQESGLFGLGGDGKRKHTKEEMQVLVRQMNESFTQAMDPRTMQVAMGRKLDDATIKSLADGMQEGETLAQFLTSNRAQGFVNKLGTAGIIDGRNANQYKNQKTGRLNADGRTLVSSILVGRLVSDADVLANTQPRTVESIARATPHMVAASSYGKGYDIGDDMAVALRDLNELRRRQADGVIKGVDEKMSESDFDGFYAQQSFFDGGDSDVDLGSAKNERAKMILWALIKKPGSQKFSGIFKNYALEAAKYPEGQAGMFGASQSPTEVLRGVIDRATKPKAEAKAQEPEKPKAPEGPGLFG